MKHKGEIAMFIIFGIMVIALSAKCGLKRDVLGVLQVSILGGGFVYIFVRQQIEKQREKEAEAQYVVKLEEKIQKYEKEAGG